MRRSYRRIASAAIPAAVLLLVLASGGLLRYDMPRHPPELVMQLPPRKPLRLRTLLVVVAVALLGTICLGVADGRGDMPYWDWLVIAVIAINTTGATLLRNWARQHQ